MITSSQFKLVWRAKTEEAGSRHSRTSFRFKEGTQKIHKQINDDKPKTISY